MSNDNNNDKILHKSINPFHRGERAIQARLGVSEQMSIIGKQAITSFMSMHHQAFLASLPMIFVGAQDREQNIWASVLMGDVGFIEANDIHHFTIHDGFLEIDPVTDALEQGHDIGFLGIQFETRRRNRVNASVLEATSSEIKLRVKQCFGNCPKYIQQRRGKMNPPTNAPKSIRLENFDKPTIEFIHAVDSFFIASQHVGTSNSKDEDSNQGIDVSHRGGMPGFIHIADKKTLLIPDYIGNNFFNTLGNISLDPKVGLQFLDYKNGHRLMLTGKAEIIWAEDQNLPFKGVDRMTRFKLDHGYWLQHSFPFEWQFESYSPFSQAYLPTI